MGYNGPPPHEPRVLWTTGHFTAPRKSDGKIQIEFDANSTAGQLLMGHRTSLQESQRTEFPNLINISLGELSTILGL